jgi:hypothetical protein
MNFRRTKLSGQITVGQMEFLSKIDSVKRPIVKKICQMTFQSNELWVKRYNVLGLFMG